LGWSAYLGARNEGERRLELVLAGDQQDVEKVGADGLDAHEYRVVVDGGLGYLADAQLVWALEPLTHHNSLHGRHGVKE